MAKGIKDTMGVILSEMTGADQQEVREWLDTVNTAEDFFGKNNRQGLGEYNHFISAREAEYKRAVKNSHKRV